MTNAPSHMEVLNRCVFVLWAFSDRLKKPIPNKAIINSEFDPIICEKTCTVKDNITKKAIDNSVVSMLRLLIGVFLRSNLMTAVNLLSFPVFIVFNIVAEFNQSF